MQRAMFKRSGGTELLTNIQLPHIPMAKALKGAILEFPTPTGLWQVLFRISAPVPVIGPIPTNLPTQTHFSST